jgi:hypothetical protein
METTLSTSSPLVRISVLKIAGQYLLAGFLSLIIACFILQIWSVHQLSSCVDYSHDGLFYAMAIKSTITSGWYLNNPFIGVPDGYSLADFPLSDGLNFLLIKVLSFFSSDWVFIHNAFLLLTFPLIALTSLFVLKQLGLQYPFALTGSLLYSLLPYHFMRGTHHLLLSAYFIVPLAIWLVFLIYHNKLFEKGLFYLTNKKKLFTYCLVCLLIGSTGIYYAYFSCFFILISGSIASYARKKFFPLAHAALLVFAICVSVIINVWPTISYQIRLGKNREVAQRLFVDSEVYGVKIAQLLLPIDGDRIELIAKLKQRYTTYGPLNNENGTATLGCVGSLGFLLLIGRIFLRKEKDFEEQTINKDALSHFTLAGLLVASIGGFSTFLAFLGFSSLRAYNRISVYLAFFAIAAFFIFLQGGLKKTALKENKKIVWTLSLFLLAFGIFNQTSKTYGLEEKRQTVDPQYRADKAFIGQIEAALPKHSMIFQLPYVSFPESLPVCKVYSYDHFRAPLCSDTLRWSFGAIRGRETDKWQRVTASYPLAKMVDELVSKGFNGIYLNRLGYQDRGAEIETQLSEILGVTPLANEDISFWDLRPYTNSLTRSQTVKEIGRDG